MYKSIKLFFTFFFCQCLIFISMLQTISDVSVHFRQCKGKIAIMFHI